MTEQEFRGKLTKVFLIDDDHVELVVTVGTSIVRGTYKRPEAKRAAKLYKVLVGSRIILTGIVAYSGHKVTCLTNVDYVEDLEWDFQ